MYSVRILSLALAYISSIATPEQKVTFDKERELDLAYTFGDGLRFRVNLHFERGNPAISMRLIPSRIPSPKELSLPASITEFSRLPRGLVLVTGPTGVGKSYLVCALGNAAARAGYTVLYIRAPRLFEALQQSRGDGSHLKALARLARVQLLIIDDFLLTSLADVERRDLLEVIEDRHQLGATIIASQCPIKDWHPNIGDPTMADAICDRLLHNAYKIEMRGDSMRTGKPGAKTERKEAIERDD